MIISNTQNRDQIHSRKVTGQHLDLFSESRPKSYTNGLDWIGYEPSREELSPAIS